MENGFQIGQQVAFLDLPGEGVVREVKGDEVRVEDESGFDNWWKSAELVAKVGKVQDYERSVVDRIREEEAKAAAEAEKEPPPPFPIGSKVHQLNGSAHGTVKRYTNALMVVIEDEHGFEESVEVSELISDEKMRKDLSRGFEEVRLTDIGEAPPNERGENSLTDRRNSGVWEVDLHIQELVDNSYGMPKAKLLEIQLDHFTSKLDWAIEKGTKRIIFIHGRGKGKLRQEMKAILERYPNCQSQDADYQKYGVGAMEVRVLYKV